MDVSTRPADDGNRRRGAALALLAATQFVLILDAAIVTVALPSIGRDLGFGTSDLSWVVNAYTLLFGGFLLLGGRLADLFGRRRQFVVGVLLFTAASLAAALSRSPAWLVAARGTQGLAAALVGPAVLSLLMITFPEGRPRTRALAVFGAVSGSAGAAGSVLGGLLTDRFGWPAVFSVTVPVGVAIVALAPRLLPRGTADPAGGRPRLDLAGAVTVTAGLVLLVYVLAEGGAQGWASARTLGSGALALALLAGFVVVESRVTHPLVPLRIVRLRTLRAANLVGVVRSMAWFPQFILLPLYTQQVLGYGPLRAGAAQVPLALAIVLGASVASRVVSRSGPRTAMAGGLAVVAVGMLWLARVPPDASFLADLLAPTLVIGVGGAHAFVANTVAATTGVPERDSGLASGLLNTNLQVGGAIGLALATAVATAGTGGAAEAAATPAALVGGFHAAFLLCAALAALAAVLAAVLLPSTVSPRADRGVPEGPGALEEVGT